MYRRTHSRLNVSSFVKLISTSGLTVGPRILPRILFEVRRRLPVFLLSNQTKSRALRNVTVSDSAAVYYDSNILAESLRDKILKLFNSFLHRYFNLVES